MKCDLYNSYPPSSQMVVHHCGKAGQERGAFFFPTGLVSEIALHTLTVVVAPLFFTSLNLFKVAFDWMGCNKESHVLACDLHRNRVVCLRHVNLVKKHSVGL